VAVGGEEAEERAQPLASRGERLGGDDGRVALASPDSLREARFQLGHVGRETRGGINGQGVHGVSSGSAELTRPAPTRPVLPEGAVFPTGAVIPTCAVCRATIEPARSRKRTSENPARSSRAASSSAPGNRATDAGR